MEKGISYLNRNYNDYKQALIEYSKKYFPDFNVTYNDASVASWLIGLNAAVADELSYHIDRVYQETNIDSAKERASLYNLARNIGVKIPGPKGSMAEVRFTCTLPVSNETVDWDYAPIIKRGTKVSSANQQFEVMEDIDFKSQFNSSGVSDRTFRPMTNPNGIIIAYTVSKLSVVVAGESKIYRQTVSTEDVKPFMEIVIPAENIMNIESIVVSEGDYSNTVPSYGNFYSEVENICSVDGNEGRGKLTRYFEVDNLSQAERWGDTIVDGKAKKFVYSYNGMQTYCVTKGEWIPVEHKFITEYTDNGYMKVIFGSGTDGRNVELGETMSDFSKWQISRMLNNKRLGILPDGGSTIFILYRIGGGQSSNVAEGAISRISLLNAEFRGEDATKLNTVKSSLSVVNTTPSVSGKDMPSNEELKYLIKYDRAAQERCVTVKDYIDRILMLPPKYGTPFRVGVMEENNKIMIYLLGVDNLGKLDTLLPVTLVKNIENYLSKYRMINDYVEIKSGRIINLSFEANVIIDKNYNKSDVVAKVIQTIKDYMDINRHIMGEEIYVGDLEKEISKVDGVINLIELKVRNETGEGYSSTTASQPKINSDDDGDSLELDLEATDGILYNDGDCMMEIKYPQTDIRIKVKER